MTLVSTSFLFSLIMIVVGDISQLPDHHDDHLDPVAGGVDKLVDCQETCVPMPDP